MKWKFLDRKSGKPIYLICNADESEPGTFKDRQIMHKDPHQLIEGMMIAAYAIQAKQAFIYIRAEFFEGACILERAIAEAKEKGFCGEKILGTDYSCDLVVHRGAGAYICGGRNWIDRILGGQKAQSENQASLFSRRSWPLSVPDHRQQRGDALQREACHGNGRRRICQDRKAQQYGTRIWCVSGQVKRPGYYEFECGALTMGEMIFDACGGLLPGRSLKAIIPGGSSAKVLRADERFVGKHKDGTDFDWGIEDIPLDFDGPMAAGSMSGSGGIIVMDDTVDIVQAMANINAFYAHESCGQCTPCREGCLWMRKITKRMCEGDAREEDPEMLLSIANQIEGRTICAFGEAAAWPTQSFVTKFRDDFAKKANPEKRKARTPSN